MSLPIICKLLKIDPNCKNRKIQMASLLKNHTAYISNCDNVIDRSWLMDYVDNRDNENRTN